MIKRLRYILTTIFLVIFLLQQQYVMGFFDFFESSERKQWKKDVTELILSTYATLVQEEERGNWKGLEGENLSIKEASACQCWIPRSENDKNHKERLSIILSYKPNRKEKRQYQDIDEAFLWYKRNYVLSDSIWKFEKINDREAFIDRDTGKSAEKSIQKKVLFGEWLIVLEYEYFPPKDIAKKIDWDQKRNFWHERFRNIKFEG